MDISTDLKNLDISVLTDDEVSELLKLLDLKSEYEKYNVIEKFVPYDYQLRFFEAGKHCKRRFLMAGNRLGKTFSQSVEMAYHLTGKYPEWWVGHRFDKPILAWAIGITGDSTQKVLQKELFGTEIASIDSMIGTGAIPKKDIIHIQRDGPRILDAKIKHISGEASTLQFRSTQAGQHVLMGSTVDYIWLDKVFFVLHTIG